MEALFLLFCKINCRTMLFLLCTCSFRLKMVNELISRPDLSIFISQTAAKPSAFLVYASRQVSVSPMLWEAHEPNQLQTGLTNIYLGALLQVLNHQLDLQSQATRISICSSELATEIPKLIPETWEQGLFHPAVDALNTKIPQHWVQKVPKFWSQKTSWPPH